MNPHNPPSLDQLLTFWELSLKGEASLFPEGAEGDSFFVLPPALILGNAIDRSLVQKVFNGKKAENQNCVLYAGNFAKEKYDGDRSQPHSFFAFAIPIKVSSGGFITLPTAPPFIQSSLVQTSSSEHASGRFTITDSHKVRSFLDLNPLPANVGLKEYIDFLQNMVEECCEDFLTANPIYKPTSKTILSVAKHTPNTILEHVYQELVSLKTGGGSLPLLENSVRQISSQSPHESPLNENELLAARCGHMSTNHSLSDGQRLALTNALNSKDGQMLAINGPPGTGKTTLLQSLVSSIWVQAAVEGKATPPLTVVCSTNNQAVTNVLKSFSSVEDRPGSPFKGRWIDGVSGYGIYLKPGESTEYFDLLDTEKLEQSDAETIKKTFLGHFRRCFNRAEQCTVDDAVVIMHQALLKGWGLLSGIESKVEFYSSASVEIAKLESEGVHGQKSPEAMRKMAAIFREKVDAYNLGKREWEHLSIKYSVTNLSLRSNKLDLMRTDLLDIAGRYELNELLEPFATDEGVLTASECFDNCIAVCQAYKQALEEGESKLTSLRAKLSDVTNDLIEFGRKIGVPDPELIEINKLDARADTYIREPLFKLASHYWEGRWIQEMDSSVWAGRIDRTFGGRPHSQAEVLKILRRRAMLTPCMVSTFHSLPRNFQFKNRLESGLVFNEIDNLIVDEAGQTTPEVGAVGLALAKRAFAVGDVYQIAPIFNTTESLDLYNGVESGLISDSVTKEPIFELLSESGFLSHNGSLMKMAQACSSIKQPGQKSPGVNLLEHRRGYDEIISFCNELCYESKLIPLRGPKPPTIEGHLPLPPLGFANIPGKSSVTRQGSRVNELEAKILARWIGDHASSLVRLTGKALSEAVAVVTPFKGQAELIQSLVNKEISARQPLLSSLYKEMGIQSQDDEGSKITIGTTHSLQGAERQIILFSPVYSKHDKAKEFFFDEDPSLLNVAVSRAKDAFIVFGDASIFDLKPGKPSFLLGEHLRKSPNSEILLPREALLRDDMCNEKSKRPPQFISDLKGHRETLRRSFELAQRDLVIVSPWVTKAALQADDILASIAGAVARGVGVRLFIGEDMNLENYTETEFISLLNDLRATGAHVTLVNKMHQKVIYIDEEVMVAGSFNWLSSSRTDQFKLMEKSIVYFSELVALEKNADLDVLAQLTSENQRISLDKQKPADTAISLH